MHVHVASMCRIKKSKFFASERVLFFFFFSFSNGENRLIDYVMISIGFKIYFD